MQRVARYLYRRGNGYTFRRNIPAYARPAFGGITEYVRSFGDVTETKAKAQAILLGEHCTRLFDEARNKGQSKSKSSDIFRIKRTPDGEEIEHAVRTWLIKIETSMSETLLMERASADQHVRDLGRLDVEVVRVMRSRGGNAPLMTRWIAETLVEANDWTIPTDGPLRVLLEDRVARGQRELAARQRAELSWEDQPRPTHRMFAPEEFSRDKDTPAANPYRQPVPLKEVLEQYFAEQEPAANTVKKWTTALNSLIEHLGHDDATRVTADDIVAWKNGLLATNDNGERVRGQRTVRDGYVGAVRPVFEWAVSNRLIETNPVIKVRVSVPRPIRMRAEKGYTDAEAKTALLASLAIDCEADLSFFAFARRWLPWLCAYTGARVGEMAQLRAEDVAQTDDGIWYVIVTPEAGTQKGGFARKVALHPHLIEMGFVAAARKRSGPLFYDPKRRRAGSTGNPQHKKVAQRVAEWVRSLGITDKELQPNHGWRHRFITVARDVGMDPDVRREITAHAAKDQHGEYGDVFVRNSSRAIANFPRYEW
ncbi:hypothetical protein SKP52_09705 [Sphingopyxis fribergensis]|uniref:Core-binding (CB) domain-containing protein n=2 Tax=Sphingopyxis fribergensis TaxID=1515612 RepID=A0A0A7PFV0_9SPHN|nr:hypothetical protein SKP52_09705 [Sphingopyxis fribergensis]